MCSVALEKLRSRGLRPLEYRESHESLTPIPELLFLVAAAAYKVSFLVGGSVHALTVGTVCLALSLAALIYSRLRARLGRRR